MRKRCKMCSTFFNDEDAYMVIEQKGVYLCSHECAQQYAQEEKEREDKDRLYRLLVRVFGKTPTSRMWADIANYYNSGLSYHQMGLIAHYAYDIKGIHPYKDSLYIIDRYQEEAKDYYAKNMQLRETVTKAQQQTISNYTTIVPNEKFASEQRKKRRPTLSVNLGELQRSGLNDI